jgi:DNA-binding PadR family transcriptional regulator
MNTIAVDTYKTINKLKAKGFTEAQAEGLVDALTESGLVTNDVLKSEIKDIRVEIANLKWYVIQWTAGMLFAQAAFIIAMQSLLS